MAGFRNMAPSKPTALILARLASSANSTRLHLWKLTSLAAQPARNWITKCMERRRGESPPPLCVWEGDEEKGGGGLGKNLITIISSDLLALLLSLLEDMSKLLP